MQQHKSPTYVNLIDLYFKMSRMMQDSPVYTQSMNGQQYQKTKTGLTSQRIMQPIVMAENQFINDCTDQEWLVIRRIMCELKEYNCLWHCDPALKKNSKNRIALNSLILKGILQKTETTHIYVVNPFYIRRGDLMAVITTTARLLENASKVDTTYITNKKPVNDYIPNQLGYGYNDDNTVEL